MRISEHKTAFAAGAVIFAAVFTIGFVSARAQFDGRFRVIYSLDKRQNDQEIIRLVNGADKYVYFAVYYFSLDDIADALIRASKRGVVVRGIVDRDASTGVGKEVFQRLTAAGILVETQRHEDGIMHAKAVVTDHAYASGSYNWTDAATEANDEILEVGTDPDVRDQYLTIIQKMLESND